MALVNSDAQALEDQISNGRRFSLSELTEGDQFIYLNRGAPNCGCVGQINSHDGGSIHVVQDNMGNMVCRIDSNTAKAYGGAPVTVTVGEGAVFVFVPTQPVFL